MTVKVMHLITELSTGGAQVALRRLLTNCDRQRFDMQVACLYNGDGAVGQQIRQASIPVHDLKMRAKTDIKAFSRLFHLLRREKPHILHTWMFHANFSGRISGRIARVPIIISAERTMGQEKWMRRRLDKATAYLADRVVCVSQATAIYAAQVIGIPESKLAVIPNGVDLADFDHLPDVDLARAAWNLPAQGVIIGAVGRLHAVKGFTYLLEAFARLAPDFPQATLLLVGDGPDRSILEQLAARYRLSQRVTFMGEQTDVPSFLAALDVLALPSLHEGMPNVVLEAMAAGLPVVASHTGGVPEVVVHGETGWLVAAADQGALCKAIFNLLNDPSRAQAMGKAGRQRVERLFNLADTISITEILYEQLMIERFDKGSTT
jgi:glycosyltransferase involved in cell wall biosynthesis